MQVNRIYGYKVQPYVFNRIANNNTPKSNNDKIEPQYDSFSFTGLEHYEKALVGAIRSDFKNENSVTYTFTNLFKEIINTHFITKSKEFEELSGMFEKMGLRSVLNSLWSAYPPQNVLNIINKAENGNIVLASHKDKPILELYNLGRHGFFNALADSKDATREVGLRFSNPKQSISADINFEKDGGLHICIRDKRKTITSGFYKETGNRKYETSQYEDAKPETTYYKKDGSESFWKNWFYGGTAVPVW